MIGGIVIEIANVKDRPNILYVDCRDRSDTCAVYVERNAKSDQIQIGDSLWWQGRLVMWTPQSKLDLDENEMICGVDYDIQIPRVGYSGVEHPSRASERETNE